MIFFLDTSGNNDARLGEEAGKQMMLDLISRRTTEYNDAQVGGTLYARGSQE